MLLLIDEYGRYCLGAFTSTPEVHLKPFAGALALMFVVSDPAFSQQTAVPAAPTVPPAIATSTPPAPNTLLDGTPVKLRLAETVSSENAKVGQQVPFEVVEEVDVQGVPVIAKGATALATVTTAEPKRRMGRGGKLDVNIDSVRLVDNEKIQLRATKEDKGGGHVGAMTTAIVATSIVFFPAAPLFLLMHGKDITIPKGTEITAFVQGDDRLDMAKMAAPAGPGTDAVAGAGATANTVGQMASLVVDSNVPGADIEIDGSFVGSTPSTLSVTPGQHTVSVKKNGYEGWSRSMNIAGNSVHLSAELTAK